MFEGRIDAFEFARLSLQIVHNDPIPGKSQHSHRIHHIGTVHFVRQVHAANGIGGAGVPEFESLVPRAGHEAGVVWRFDPVARFDGRVVLSHLLRLVRRQVPHLYRLVAGGAKDFGSVVRPAHVQHWRRVSGLNFGHRLPCRARRLNLPARHFESHDPAIRYVCCTDGGEKDMDETESSGADATSTLFIGLCGAAAGPVPNPLPPGDWLNTDGDPNPVLAVLAPNEGADEDAPNRGVAFCVPKPNDMATITRRETAGDGSR